jgi:dihydrolipoamide dehydrogenase
VRDFDVCVIGGGPSGYAAAMRSYDLGKRVALIEKGALGGAGVHNGALSSKTLWELSRDYRRVLRNDRGFHAHAITLDYKQVCQCVHEAVAEKVGQLERQLAALEKPQDGSGSLQRIAGSARFIDPHTMLVQGPDGTSRRTLTADHFIVCTGSRPRSLPDLPIDGHHILTSDHITSLSGFPRSLVVLGAGVVGCEFATIFANYGQTKVHLIDRAPRILPFEDDDVARVCANNLEHKGVTVHGHCRLVSMRVVDDQVEYVIEQHGGGHETIRVDAALISIGRVPNTTGLGLEDIGVQLTPTGYIVNDDTCTTVPHIYAAGDVTDDIALVNVGEIEGRHAAERIAGAAAQTLSYENLSTIMFLDPEVAAIGINELTAQERRIPYRVAVYGYALVNRAIAMRSTDGFVKLLTTDDPEPRILGMRALGVHASTMIEGVSMMIQHGRSIRELAELLHPHPAVTEGLQDCVRMLLGSSVYKPSVFTSELRLSRITYE